MTRAAAGEVRLGFERGTGTPVYIPFKHMAVTGQTQEAGKTTTLEALIGRSLQTAVTFITKRGEGSFAGAHQVAPYFREQADWQFVASILEASRGEKLKFERAWIIRASRGASTLQDVHRNVIRALNDPKTRGLSADVYLVLDAYLTVVVPQIAAVKWATSLQLQPGVNAVDLSRLPLEMQHLVIRSTLDWVLNREQGTVVVIPEAWKFIPQGRGTPVKLGAEAFIRQGAALGNYLWLDSQDLGGIDKAILRSVAVWLLGVQREANELKRTLENIPAGTSKPKAADLATLELGEFFACWGRHAVRTYVQPPWLTEEQAQGIAQGDVARPLFMYVKPEPKQEKPEMCELHAELERKLASRQRGLEAAQAEARAADAFLQASKEELAAAGELRAALAKFLGAPPAAGAFQPVQVTTEVAEGIVAQVLARIPAGGAVVRTVTPPEKLREDFALEVVARLEADAAALKPLAAKALKYLLAVVEDGGPVRAQRAIAEGLGRATAGGSWVDLGKALGELAAAGFAEVVERQGWRPTVRARVARELEAFRAPAPVVEGAYQTVLYAIAQGAGA